MALTRIEMVSEICDTVGKKTTATTAAGTLLGDRVVTYLNFAQRKIARHYSFYELQAEKTDAATVIDAKTYPLESGTNTLGLSRVASVNSIILDDSENSRKLDFWHYRKFDKFYPRPENYSSGRPQIYTRWGNNLILFKIPDAVYTLKIRYGQYANDLVADSQVTDFGEDKDQLILTAGILETYLALKEYTDARAWYELFIGQLEDAVRAEGDEDWEPEAQPFGNPSYSSGSPWNDPYGGSGDALYNYPE
jgi:hypothetical protein